MKPLVSVVIPTYNRVQELEHALKSILSQTYSNWEVLVVDNYSDDNTEELIESLNEPRIKSRKIHNKGVIASSRNLGVKHSKGKYIAFLDSDDWWFPDKLEQSVMCLEQGFDIVYHDLYIVKKYHQKIYFKKTKSRKLQSPVFDDLITKGNALSNSSVVVRRDVFNKIGGFSEDKNLVAIEDYDCWLRISKYTNKFKKLPKTLGCYWLGGGNTSNLKRTIKVTEAIQSVYANETSKMDCNTTQYFEYVKGRAYYLLGNKFEAINSLRKIKYNKFPPSFLYIKSKFMLFFIGVKS